jgi:hypothetical protein
MNPRRNVVTTTFALAMDDLESRESLKVADPRRKVLGFSVVSTTLPVLMAALICGDEVCQVLRSESTGQDRVRRNSSIFRDPAPNLKSPTEV